MILKNFIRTLTSLVNRNQRKLPPSYAGKTIFQPTKVHVQILVNKR